MFAEHYKRGHLCSIIPRSQAEVRRVRVLPTAGEGNCKIVKITGSAETVGGAVVLARMFFALRGLAEQYAYLTFVIAGAVALVSAAAGYFSSYIN